MSRINQLTDAAFQAHSAAAIEACCQANRAAVESGEVTREAVIRLVLPVLTRRALKYGTL